MKLETRRTLRFNDAEWETLRLQAEKLGTDRTSYIKLIMSLDASTRILETLVALDKNKLYKSIDK